MDLTHFSLFTGIGGIDLAAEWAGFKTVGQCEFADYPTKVLEKHWSDVPRWRDIRDVTMERFKKRTGLSTVKLVSGGFPCQPFSVAGKRKGKEDDRYLWPEMLRVIQEFKPDWVLGENVAGIVNMALDKVLSDLEAQGYSTQAFIIPAVSVNAAHRRDRVFIVGYAKHHGLSSAKIGRGTNKASNDIKKGENEASQFEGTSKSQYGKVVGNFYESRCNREYRWEYEEKFENGSENVSNPMQSGCQKFYFTEKPDTQRFDTGGAAKRGNNWEIEPELGRVANGIPCRVDRLKCLGNAVVPQQVYPILKAIADIERFGET